VLPAPEERSEGCCDDDEEAALKAGGSGITGGDPENAILGGPFIPCARPDEEDGPDEPPKYRLRTLVVPAAGPHCAVGKSVSEAFPAFFPVATYPGISGIGMGSSDSTIATSSDGAAPTILLDRATVFYRRKKRGKSWSCDRFPDAGLQARNKARGNCVISES